MPGASRQFRTEAGIVISDAPIEIMKVFKGEKVVITPRDLGQLRDADLVFMDLLSTLDHHRPQGQKFVAIVVVALGIGQGRQLQPSATWLKAMRCALRHARP